MFEIETLWSLWTSSSARPTSLSTYTPMLKTSGTSHCRKRSFARYRSNWHNEQKTNNYDLFDNIVDFWISLQFFHQCIKLLVIESIKSVFCFTYDVKIIVQQASTRGRSIRWTQHKSLVNSKQKKIKQIV